MESPTYYLYRVWYRTVDYLQDIFCGRRLKWFIQRRRQGFDDRELWSLDYTIAKYVYPRLKVFNKLSKVSIASCFFADEEKVEHDDADWAVAKKNQKDAYDKIEQAFFYILDDDESVATYYGLGERCMDDNKVVFPTLDEEEWKLYRKEMDRRAEVIEEGLKIFAKYFRTLWD